MTSKATRNTISSPASVVGAVHYDKRIGPTIEKFGLEAVLASLSPSRAKEVGLLTIATCGPISDISSRSAALQSSLESRLRQRLNGSDLCEVIWKPWATPWGQCLSRPRARVRTTCEIDTGLWQTMVQDDALDREGGKVNSRGEPKLSAQAIQSATWPTATTRDHKDGAICANVPINGLRGRMVWPTPTSLAKAKDGNNEAGNSAGLVAIRKHAMAATWATAVAQPANGTPEAFLERKRKSVAKTGRSMGICLSDLQMQAHPPMSGSSAPTEKRGALNPEFVCWLMGYPTEWVNCAGSETRSTRARRQPSSPA